MSKYERLIRSILGLTNMKIDRLVCALEVMEHLVFDEGVRLSDIHVTKDICPVVHKRCGRGATQRSVGRNMERVANACWDAMDAKRRMEIVGRELPNGIAPSIVMQYLMLYGHFDKPFQEMVSKDPALLF